MAWIKNINGASVPPCGCRNWYEHWAKEADQWLICCAEYSCTNPIYRGVLAQNAEIEDENWYVVPLCKKHAYHMEVIDVGDVKLINAVSNNSCRGQRG